MKYHTLLVSRHRGPWEPEFGDYDKDVVMDEFMDMAGQEDSPALRLRTITSADDQESIDAAVKEFNDHARDKGSIDL